MLQYSASGTLRLIYIVVNLQFFPRAFCQLEKFKFVLDFKIKELKRQIEPRETEIGSMKEQIKEMDKELEQVSVYTPNWDKRLEARIS